MEDHHTLNTTARSFAAVAAFVEAWPEATIHDLAKAMPTIMSEAARREYSEVTVARAGSLIIDVLRDQQLVPPWVDSPLPLPPDGA